MSITYPALQNIKTNSHKRNRRKQVWTWKCIFRFLTHLLIIWHDSRSTILSKASTIHGIASFQKMQDSKYLPNLQNWADLWLLELQWLKQGFFMLPNDDWWSNLGLKQTKLALHNFCHWWCLDQTAAKMMVTDGVWRLKPTHNGVWMVMQQASSWSFRVLCRNCQYAKNAREERMNVFDLQRLLTRVRKCRKWLYIGLFILANPKPKLA